ncbi:MAG: hypothetical protein JNM63_10290 [Spirochaetia bacterium]|nr:hypothetical protein [Spirochaetia bacterium]
MANANAAVPISGSVIFGNPALLAKISRPIAAVSVLPRGLGLELEDTFLFNAAANVVLPLKEAGGAGLSWNGYFSSMETDTTYNENRLAAAYGICLFKKLSVGGTLLLESWGANGKDGLNLLSYGAPLSINANIGVHYQLSPNLGLALVGRRLFGSALSGGKDRDESAPTLCAGVGWLNPNWVGAFDAEYLFALSTFNLKLGFELQLAKGRLHLGAGAELLGLAQSFTPSLGIGLRLGPFVFDYAIAYPIPLGGAGNHLFTITVGF